jgi:hypothetical protein
MASLCGGVATVSKHLVSEALCYYLMTATHPIEEGLFIPMIEEEGGRWRAAALSRTYSAFALRLSHPEVCVFSARQQVVPTTTRA